MSSKQFKNYQLDQQIYWEFDKYVVGKVWICQQDLATFANQYYLKIDIWALEHKNMSIQEFYSAITDLLD